MTIGEAITYLDGRGRDICDRLGNGQHPGWNSRDVHALRLLLQHVAQRDRIAAISRDAS